MLIKKLQPQHQPEDKGEMVTDEVSPQFWQGVEAFNQQEFYACHDILEEIWMEAIEPQRTFYQGILQVAVGLYHLSNDNWNGAVMLLGEGVRRLDRYRPDYGGVDVESLWSESLEWLQSLQQAGAEGAADFYRSRSQSFPRVRQITNDR